MFHHYLKIALRAMRRQWGYAFINITGLAVGIACSLLIVVWVLDELSYDRFHADYENIYRVEQDQNYSGEIFHVYVTPHPMGPALKAEVPEVANSTRLFRSGGMLLRRGAVSLFESQIAFVDPSFLDMFTFPLRQGNKTSCLNDPYSLVITSQIAEKYFSGEDPIGKSVLIDQQHQFTVTGVLEKIPAQSSLQFELLIPYQFLVTTDQANDNWGNNSILTFVQLHPSSDLTAVGDKISEMRQNRVADRIRSDNPDRVDSFLSAPRVEFSVFPIKDIHLFGYFGFGRPMGNIQYVYIFSAIGLFILLIACINFMNLATARSANRAREVGLRKVVGAVKRQLIQQFYGEAGVVCLLSTGLAILLVSLALPAFNTLTGKELSMELWRDGRVILGLVFVALLTAVLAGSYPSLFLSAFQPINVLRGTLQRGAKSGLYRKVLVIVQFTLSILLIIGTLVIFDQVEYIRNKKLGYDQEQVLCVPIRGDIRLSYDRLKNRWLADPHILGVSGSGQRPNYIGSNSGGAEWDGKNPDDSVLIGFNAVDFDFLKTMGIQLAEGRDFSLEYGTDATTAFLVNEEVVKIMGVPSGVNQSFSFAGREGTIVGVMKNFHYQPLQRQIEPIAFMISREHINFILVRVKPDDIEASVAAVDRIWREVLPEFPLEYRFLDQDFDRMYRAEQRLGSLTRLFAGFAIFVAGLGLFGLAAFAAEQRTKEIGIRKVLGASSIQLVLLLCREFFWLVTIASVLAWISGGYIMYRWLEGFAYRTGLDPVVFAGSGLAALLVAMATVSYQAIRAALINPAESLKHE